MRAAPRRSWETAYRASVCEARRCRAFALTGSAGVSMPYLSYLCRRGPLHWQHACAIDPLSRHVLVLELQRAGQQSRGQAGETLFNLSAWGSHQSSLVDLHLGL